MNIKPAAFLAILAAATLTEDYEPLQESRPARLNISREHKPRPKPAKHEKHPGRGRPAKGWNPITQKWEKP